MGQSCQRLFEAGQGLSVRRARECLGAGLTEVRDRLLPYLTSHRMVSQPFDMLGQPGWIAALDGAHNPGVQEFAPFLEQGTVGDFVGERMLEGVFGIRK
jgi:hypothetical protein